MDLQRHVCWQRSLLSRVMETEALQEKDHFFAATHSPARIGRASEVRADATGETVTQHQLLDELLDPDRRHVLMAVIGSSGSGKSHLVRWLGMNIPEGPGRKVLVIPKVGTNLRKVLELILRDMEGPRFDEYRERLRAGVERLTPELAELRFLADIAIAVGPAGPERPPVADIEKQEFIDALKHLLPPLLNDEVFRRHLRQHSEVVKEIAQHIVGEAGRERRETRREFRDCDLDVSRWSVKSTDLNAEARDAFDWMTDERFRHAAVEWMNTNLDWTVSQMLNLTGEDLNELMLAVRADLGRQGCELVLLVEDFAKTQGIDAQLLEALLVRPDQHQTEGRLCTLRSVMAVTDGYYQGLPETVRTRMDAVVTLDTVDMSSPTAAEVVTGFAARYLNAVRVKEADLVRWHGSLVGTESQHRSGPPSACADCPHSSGCHRLFGAVNGMGLYPFNRQALMRMYAVVQESEGKAHFNARRLIKQVLRHTLETYGGDVREGTFPSKRLMNHFGGSSMSAVAQARLSGTAVADEADRMQALLEFWGDPVELVFNPNDLPQAFGLTPLTENPPGLKPKLEDEPEPTEPKQTRGEPMRGGLLEQVTTRCGELDEWKNGGVLSQHTSQALRDLLFSAVCANIDWDTEGMAQAHFAGANRDFRATSINFVRQGTGGKGAPVVIELPTECLDTNATTLGLQGLLLYSHHGHWQFDNAHVHLLYYASLLGAVSDEVLAQLRKPASVEEPWDPVPAATQLLAMSAVVTGQAGIFGEPHEQVNAIFGHWIFPQDEQLLRSDEWVKLHEACSDAREDLQGIVLSRVVATKGGGYRSAQMVAPSRLLEPIAEAVSQLAGLVDLPRQIPDDCRGLRRLSKEFERRWEKAVRGETARFREVADLIEMHMHSGTSWAELADELELTIAAAKDQGVGPEPVTNQLRSILGELRDVDTRMLLSTLAALRTPDEEARVRAISQSNVLRPLRVARHTVEKSLSFLSGLEKRTAAQAESLRAAAEWRGHGSRLVDALRELRDVTGEVACGH